MEAVRLVTAHTRGDGAGPSVEYSRALEEIERSLPAFEPAGKGGGTTPARKAAGALDVGAYEYVGK